MKIKLKSKHNFLRHALAGAAGLAMLAGTATAATTSICDAAGGYVVAYYNDTLALPDDADAQRAAMRIARHGRNTTGSVETLTSDTGTAEPVRYESFYSLTPTQLQALASAYRSALDGALSAHWEYFWDFLGGDNSAWSTLAGRTGDSRFTALTSSFAAQVTSQKAASVSALTTVGNTQKARIQALYTERQKVTLASLGSQGTLFADQSFTAIGSPSNSSALRLSLTSRPGTSDATALAEKMAALQTPTGLHNNQGFFTATVSWSVPAAALTKLPDGSDQRNDFDLHVVEPTGTHVYYGAAVDNKGGGATPEEREGDAGKLDQDSSTTGPEHYYASCDEVGVTTFVRNQTQRTRQLREGIYQITVAQQSVAMPAQSYVTLQIAFAKSGEVFSKTWNAELAKTDKSTACPDCNGEVKEFRSVSGLKPQVKVKVTKIADGNWKAELVD